MVDAQLDIFDLMEVSAEPVYGRNEFATKYDLSPGQAMAIFILYGPNRRKLDAIMGESDRVEPEGTA